MSQKTLIVTGAAGGIGAATARLAAARGWAVAVHYRSDPEGAKNVVAEIVDAGGVAQAFRADIGNEVEVIDLFCAVDKALPPLGGLVNNAARVAPRAMRLDEMDAAEIDGLMRVNVTGAMIAAREAAARLSTAKGGAGGTIVNVSSLAAVHGAPKLYVHYAASKAAVDAFTHGFALEVAREGIRVMSVRPGLIDTPIHARAGMAGRIEKVGPRMPMARAGTPDEVANAIVWLLSDEASYITGTTLDVGGGA
ncbi:SDR family oxidoreductase [Lutimaribacter sp. EGI FJ00015]|uniref:SDR family oxidoreductase n=1 Tax=Lutimaribacter degradans TaxID=2945989 RepID=A0ACC5ZTJ4_9RHOB|nr:SDR family oxidoreductase [Lutimaribacter sp. EGI FJ00013]MCM2561668.1 SDR family oxidoreductase [Lutimaribacter sp. EGI FJ00013]MCO0612620.1 SDR family oxidoreductase [Lutimaribacter sp. EGI FJ00015]MCO0635278.1 SDR family oxidoreductase [Lutimaribacter sp. EGI FJ00014]